jgi:hypothetical protein
MAQFPNDMSCNWLATGEIICPIQTQIDSTEKYENVSVSSTTQDNRVELGDNCTSKTCRVGTCYRKEGDKDAFCKNVLWKNQLGCKLEKHTECKQGLACVDNKCLLNELEAEQLPSKSTTLVLTNIKNSQRLNVFTYMFTYMFIGIMILLLIIIMILLIINGLSQRQLSATSS